MRLSTKTRTFLLLVVVWTGACGAIFLIARQLDTPVRSAGFGHREAQGVALAVLIGRDSETYGDYIVINSARSALGAPDGRDRWIVLCNLPRGGTRESAIIVEIDRNGLDVLGFRRPGETELEPHLP